MSVSTPTLLTRRRVCRHWSKGNLPMYVFCTWDVLAHLSFHRPCPHTLDPSSFGTLVRDETDVVSFPTGAFSITTRLSDISTSTFRSSILFLFLPLFYQTKRETGRFPWSSTLHRFSSSPYSPRTGSKSVNKQVNKTRG